MKRVADFVPIRKSKVMHVDLPQPLTDREIEDAMLEALISVDRDAVGTFQGMDNYIVSVLFAEAANSLVKRLRDNLITPSHFKEFWSIFNEWPLTEEETKSVYSSIIDDVLPLTNDGVNDEILRMLDYPPDFVRGLFDVAVNQTTLLKYLMTHSKTKKEVAPLIREKFYSIFNKPICESFVGFKKSHCISQYLELLTTMMNTGQVGVDDFDSALFKAMEFGYVPTFLFRNSSNEAKY